MIFFLTRFTLFWSLFGTSKHSNTQASIRIQYVPQSLHILPKCDVAGASRAVFVLSVLPKHIVPTVNHILGHDIITLNFPQHGNDLSAPFLERNIKFYRVTLMLETHGILKFRLATKTRILIISDVHCGTNCRQLA